MELNRSEKVPAIIVYYIVQAWSYTLPWTWHGGTKAVGDVLQLKAIL